MSRCSFAIVRVQQVHFDAGTHFFSVTAARAEHALTMIRCVKGSLLL
jgi:hypothetical protein